MKFSQRSSFLYVAMAYFRACGLEFVSLALFLHYMQLFKWMSVLWLLIYIVYSIECLFCIQFHILRYLDKDMGCPLKSPTISRGSSYVSDSFFFNALFLGGGGARFGCLGLCRECRFVGCVLGSGGRSGMRWSLKSSVCVRGLVALQCVLLETAELVHYPVGALGLVHSCFFSHA